jgi:NitT/TauT family transport system substrate-binding protein
VVRKAGGDPTKVSFVELPFPNMGPALPSGQVDAIFVVGPFVTSALDAGNRILSSVYADTAPNLTVAVYFASKQISSSPDLVRRFVAAMREPLAHAVEVRQRSQAIPRSKPTRRRS